MLILLFAKNMQLYEYGSDRFQRSDPAYPISQIWISMFQQYAVTF